MELENTIGYWLSYAQRCYAAAFFDVLRMHCSERGKTYVITPPQWALISLLSQNDGQTIGSLAQQLGVDAPAVTNVVKRLEQSDLVGRVRDREDQRVVTVSLTTEGQDIMRSLRPLVVEFNERVLSEEQRQALLAQLQHLITTVSTIAPGSGDRFGFLKKHLEQEFGGR